VLATPNGWTRISGPAGAGRQLGLVRTPDGTLHAIWSHRDPGAPATILDTRLARSGAVEHMGTIVIRGWDGTGGIAALPMPDRTVHLFVTGGHTQGLPPAEVGVNTLTGHADGSGWTLQPGAVWGGAAAGAAPFLGTTLTRDGQPVTAWVGAGVAAIKLGLDPTSPAPQQICACAATRASVATDQQSGAVVVGGVTIGSPAGSFMEQALPTGGPRQLVPSLTQDGSSGLTARIGAGGVYTAWTNGKAVDLTRYQGPTTQVVRGPYTSADAFAAPDGRLWVVFGDDRDGLYATRSNEAVTRFEPIQHLGAPGGTSTLWNTAGDASTGPLDLFADVSTGPAARGYWHTRVLGRESLLTRVSHIGGAGGKTAVSFVLTDAGDPIAGARVVIAHGGTTRTLTTDSTGKASLLVDGGGKLTAKAIAPGYTTTLVGLLLPAPR
jgi:hypothetical protein